MYKDRHKKIEYTCNTCNKKFFGRKDRKRKYCSLPCAWEGEERNNILKIKASGKNNPWFGKKRPQHSKIMAGKNSPFWKGGKSKTGAGHILVKAPKDHPNIKSNGYIMEHRLKMEKYLGRYLEPNEIVHHKNEIKSDNRIKNLELVTAKTHRLKHVRSGWSHSNITRKKISESKKRYYEKVREALKLLDNH